MPKILITGGAGYIGSNTAHILKRRGYEVVVVDDLSRGHQHNVTGLPFHRLNLGETQALAELLKSERCDAIVHFAAYIAVGESTQKPELYFGNNVGGTLSLLSAMVESGVTRLVFSSTAAVYGMPEVVPIPESSPFAPVSPYGESKLMVEKVLRWMHDCRGLNTIALRYFNACGADPESSLGEEHHPETHLIPLLFQAVMTGEPITIFGNDYETPDGTCIRDYIHIVDLAEAHLLALEHLMAGGDPDAFNVGTGAGHSVMEVVRAVEEVTGVRVPYEIGPRREGDAPVLVANADKLKRTFGWQPQYPNIREMVETAWQFEKSRSHSR